MLFRECLEPRRRAYHSSDPHHARYGRRDAAWAPVGQYGLCDSQRVIGAFRMSWPKRMRPDTWTRQRPILNPAGALSEVGIEQARIEDARVKAAIRQLHAAL